MGHVCPRVPRLPRFRVRMVLLRQRASASLRSPAGGRTCRATAPDARRCESEPEGAGEATILADIAGLRRSGDSDCRSHVSRTRRPTGTGAGCIDCALQQYRWRQLEGPDLLAWPCGDGMHLVWGNL